MSSGNDSDFFDKFLSSLMGGPAAMGVAEACAESSSTHDWSHEGMAGKIGIIINNTLYLDSWDSDSEDEGLAPFSVEEQDEEEEEEKPADEIKIVASSSTNATSSIQLPNYERRLPATEVRITRGPTLDTSMTNNVASGSFAPVNNAPKTPAKGITEQDSNGRNSTPRSQPVRPPTWRSTQLELRCQLWMEGRCRHRGPDPCPGGKHHCIDCPEMDHYECKKGGGKKMVINQATGAA